MKAGEMSDEIKAIHHSSLSAFVRLLLPTIMPSGGINKCRGPKASNRGALAA